MPTPTTRSEVHIPRRRELTPERIAHLPRAKQQVVIDILDGVLAQASR